MIPACAGGLGCWCRETESPCALASGRENINNLQFNVWPRRCKSNVCWSLLNVLTFSNSSRSLIVFWVSCFICKYKLTLKVFIAKLSVYANCVARSQFLLQKKNTSLLLYLMLEMFPVAAAVFTDNATLARCQSMVENASLYRRTVTAAGRRARFGASQLVQLLMQQDSLPEASLLWLCQYLVSACLWALVPSMDLGKCDGLLQ